MRRPHRRFVGVSLLGFAVFLLTAGGLSVTSSAATPQQIEEAIRKGRQYLLSQQADEGRWEKDPKRVGTKHDHEHQQGQTFGGYSAIATYALLASGSKVDDEPIAKAIDFLKKADIDGTYSAGLRAQVWLYMPDTAERKVLVARDLDLLKRTLNQKGPGKGLWDYEDLTVNGVRIDHSVAQYGVLGLWAAAQAGMGTDDKTWQLIEDTWRSHQMSSGAWSYDGDAKTSKPASAAMTAAGVATLFITQDFLLNNAGIVCKENPLNKNIDDGIKWMSDNIGSIRGNPYAWYGVERIGMASGLKYFGDKNWYATGADDLVAAQKADGSWVGGFAGATGVPATSYAVLFLARGRSAIAINKLQYGATAEKGKGSTWNQRPRDAANLTKYLGWKSEGAFKWQTVNLKVSADDLHDAPILYIAGSGSFTINDEESAKLRDYIQGGGTILANANCGKILFTRTLKAAVQKIFPKYEFRKLPADHPIFTKQQFPSDKWREQIEVEALGNGVREFVILIPDADTGRAWQLRNELKKAENEDKFQLGANVFAYATDRSRSTLASSGYVVKDAGGVGPTKSMKVLRIDVGANSDPEPGGWQRLTTIFKNAGKIGLDVELAKPTPEKLSPAVLAHLTGTGKFTFAPEERAAIKSFVEQGGTLFVDAAGGNIPFADAAEDELGQIFGDAAKAQLKTPLPPTHPLYANPEHEIKEVKYRRFAKESTVGELNTPRIRGITMPDGKRVGVFFSREDLTVGLVGQSVYGILGYEPATATELMGNVIFYASQNGKGSGVIPPAAGPVAGADPKSPTTPTPPGSGPKPPATPAAKAPAGEPLPF